jgi:hypothetical protein
MKPAKIALLVVWMSTWNSLQVSAGALPNALGDPIARPRFPGGGSIQSSRLAVVGDLVYVADGYLGLAIYDVHNPAAPRQVCAYPTHGAAVAVQVVGNNAWVSTLAGRLTFDVSDPAHPQQIDPVSSSQDRVEDTNRKRLDNVKLAHAVEYSHTGGPIAAVVGDRLYISRDDGVVVLELHGSRLPSLPAVASRLGADPISTEAWLPNRSAAQESSMEARAQDAPAANPMEASMPMAKEEGFVPIEQPLHLAPPSLQPITMTGFIESGTFRLSVSGLPGHVVRVQRSSSVAGGWEEWQTTKLGDAPIELTDEQAAGADQIFYRAVSP